MRDGANAAGKQIAAHDELSPDQLQELEKSKLRHLLRHAYDNVPYYRATMDSLRLKPEEVGDGKDLRELPILTKDTIRAQLPKLVSRDLEGNRNDTNSTSGSTGSPLEFFTDQRSKAFRKATVARNRRWLGISAGDPIVHLWGSPIDEARAQALRGRIHALVTQEKFLSAYSLSDSQLAAYVDEMNRHRMRLLVGYPSVLCEFADFCRQRSLGFPSLQAVICSAEALYPDQRKTIESGLQVPLYNRYGCREVGDIAHEIPGHEGLLVNSDRIHVEIVKPNGDYCAAGEVGEVLLTDLDNFGMPMVRYQVGDRASWLSRPDRESGGLPYPSLANVEGRSLDVVLTPSGNRIGGTFWTILFRKRPGIAAFQVVQDSLNGIVVRFVRAREAEEIDFDYFAAMIAETCGPDLSVKFQQVEEITPEPSGKYRIVVSRIEQAAAGGSEV